MLEKIKVAVKDESIVLRNPKTRLRISTTGEMVEKNAFWLRRIKEGDVVVLEQQASNQISSPEWDDQ